MKTRKSQYQVHAVDLNLPISRSFDNLATEFGLAPEPSRLNNFQRQSKIRLHIFVCKLGAGQVMFVDIKAVPNCDLDIQSSDLF